MRMVRHAGKFGVVIGGSKFNEEKDYVKSNGFRFNGDSKLWLTDDLDKVKKAIADGCTYDREVGDAINAAIKLRKDSMAMSRSMDSAFEPPAPKGLSYMPFQKAGIEYAIKRKHTLIADEMGTGKTIESAGIINSLPGVKKVIIICPASLKINWSREMAKWLVIPRTINIVNGNGFNRDADINIINYDILGKHLLEITSIQYDLLICDESHYLKNPDKINLKVKIGEQYDIKKNKMVPIYEDVKNPKTGKPVKIYKTQRVQAVMDIAKVCERIVFLTGTPITSRPKELFTTLNLMMPEKFWNFFTYAQEFCGAYKSRWGWDFSGSSNEEKLQVILRQNIMIRRLKKDVMKELPPKIRQVIELSSAGFESIIRNEKDTYENMSEEQKILTLEAELALAEENEVRYQEIVARLREVNGILFSEMSELRKKTALAKLPQCIDYIKDMLESVDKLVVFAHHHEVIDGLMAEFGEIAVKIDGRVSTTKRQEPVDRFQNDPKVRMFIGNMTAAGVGITLTAASNVVFCELAWNPGDLSQAEDRCHRKGQQENVYVVHLVFQDSLDCNMAKKLVDKQNVIDGIFNREVEDLDTSTYTSIEEARRASEGISDPKIRELVLSGLREVVMGCDGAAARDDHGFNKIDARIGRDLAGRYSLSPKQAALGKKILRKYRRQVSSQVYEGIYGKG